MDIAVSATAFGKYYIRRPSANYVKSVKRYGSIFSRTILKKELEYWLREYLYGTGLSVSLQVQEPPREVPDMDPQVIFVRYPSVLSMLPGQEQ